MSSCCRNTTNDLPAEPLPPRRWFAWIAPGILFALTPKCPVCVAGYVAMFTGWGISLTAATYLRWAWLALCVLVLAYFVFNRTGLRRSRFLAFRPLSRPEQEAAS